MLNRYRERFTMLRAALFPRWRSYTSWRLLCGYWSGWRGEGIEIGFCERAHRVIWISLRRRGTELHVILVHEMVHAVGLSATAGGFSSRLRRAADVAHDHGMKNLSWALRLHEFAYELQVRAETEQLFKFNAFNS